MNTKRHSRTHLPLLNRTLCGCVALVLTIAGCKEEKKQQAFVAKVGDAVLTEEELAAVHYTSPERPVETRKFVHEWITSELLYQEASRRGFANSDQLLKELESIRKRLAIQALLDNVVYIEDTVAVNEDAITTMYNSGASAFLLREDVLNVSYALFSDRDIANNFRSGILRGSSWDAALTSIQHDSLTHRKLLLAATRQYVTRANLYPDELWRLARSLPKDEASFVLKTDAGYYVVMTHSIRQTGEMPELEYIRNEIRSRLLIDQRRLAYERLLSNLRSKTRVELGIELPDTVSDQQELSQ